MTPAETGTHLIDVRNVSKEYVMGENRIRALESVSLTIARGEFVSVMGPSGSDKSTLMNIIGCLTTPPEGSYLLAGQDVSRLGRDELARIRNRTMGFVFQGFNLLEPEYTINRLLPIELISWEMRWRAAEPIDNMAITAATPMIMPSMVSPERILLARRARSAMVSVERGLIISQSPRR